MAYLHKGSSYTWSLLARYGQISQMLLGKNIFVPMHIFYRLRIQFIDHNKPALIGYKFDVILNLQIGIFYQSYGWKFVFDLLKHVI